MSQEAHVEIGYMSLILAYLFVYFLLIRPIRFEDFVALLCFILCSCSTLYCVLYVYRNLGT